LVQEAAPERDGQADERRAREDERREGERPGPPRHAVDETVELVSCRRERERAEDAEAERRVEEDRVVARPVIAPRPFDLFITKVGPNAVHGAYTLPRMATEDVPLPAATGEPRNELAFQWRRLGWAATAVALLSSPAAIAW